MGATDQLKNAIERGDLDRVAALLETHPALANRPIRWHLNQDNESDPLHYLSDCVSNGWLSSRRAGELARVLLDHGALVDGSSGKESPLIGAASLGVEPVASVLIEAGADLEATAIFAANALHWAAWMGLAATTRQLIERGMRLETPCSEFGATPLFWAVHGFSRHGPTPKRDQLGAARVLLEAGATVHTINKQGQTVLELAEDSDSPAMRELLRSFSSST